MIKGSSIKYVEEMLGREIGDVVDEWLENKITLQSGLDEIYRKHHIVTKKEKRKIRGAFQRFIDGEYDDDEKKELFRHHNIGDEYLQVIANHYGIYPDKVFDYIIENNVSISDLVHEIYGHSNDKVYVWLYNRIREIYGMNAVRKVCPNKKYYRRRRQRVASYLFLSSALDEFQQLFVNVNPVRSVPRILKY